MKKYDVLAIGNAIVDISASLSDAELKESGVQKGAMTLIDIDAANRLNALVAGRSTQICGGSAANTVAGIASLGGTPVFIGKVADDDLGRAFAGDMRKSGVAFESRPLESGLPSARCFVMVSPDAERTMNTYLGACGSLTDSDIDESVVAQTELVYLEGYLWDKESAKSAMMKAIKLAKKHGIPCAFTLSDSFCVKRHRADFLSLIQNGAKIIFANEEEIKSLYQTNSVESAVSSIQRDMDLAVITLGAKGAMAVSKTEIVSVDAIKPAKVVDTTGAGDMFAAGFLYGYTRKNDLKTCLEIGAIAASEIISHFGARPQTPLATLI